MIARQKTALAAIFAIFTLLSACNAGNSPILPDSTPVVPGDFAFRLCDNPGEDRFDNCEPVALRSDILIASATGLSTDGFAEFNIDPTVCTQNGCVHQSQATHNPNNDGYAYYIGQVGDQLYAYSGILASTDVGLPLPVFRSPQAVWRGEWSLNGALPTSSPDDDFVIGITYADRRFVGNGTKIIDGVAHRLNVSGFYTASGVFDTAPGRGAQADLLRAGVTYQGVLVGLIGQERAVGAFHSSDITTGITFAGGFVVREETR